MAENIENINATGEEKKPLNFVQQFVAEDLAAGKNGGRLNTRFPPEPNGYLHIGHAKAICMDFGVAEMFGGTCNLRFDDTNPQKEDTEYVEAIMRDIHWLGYDWGDRLYYASDYFPKLYDFAIRLIKEGKATARMLKSHDRWYGVTYKEDKESVSASLNGLKASGLYPEDLWK